MSIINKRSLLVAGGGIVLAAVLVVGAVAILVRERYEEAPVQNTIGGLSYSVPHGWLYRRVPSQDITEEQVYARNATDAALSVAGLPSGSFDIGSWVMPPSMALQYKTAGTDVLKLSYPDGRDDAGAPKYAAGTVENWAVVVDRQTVASGGAYRCYHILYSRTAVQGPNREFIECQYAVADGDTFRFVLARIATEEAAVAKDKASLLQIMDSIRK